MWEGICLFWLAVSAGFVRGDPELAGSLFQEALTVLREVNFPSGVAMTLGNLGAFLLTQGRVDEAQTTLRESLALRFALRDRYGTPEQVQDLARVAAVKGDLEQATRLWAAGDQLRRDLGADVSQASREEHERFVGSLKERLGPEQFAHVCTAGQALTLEQAVAEALSVTDKVVTGMRS